MTHVRGDTQTVYGEAGEAGEGGAERCRVFMRVSIMDVSLFHHSMMDGHVSPHPMLPARRRGSAGQRRGLWDTTRTALHTCAPDTRDARDARETTRASGVSIVLGRLRSSCPSFFGRNVPTCESLGELPAGGRGATGHRALASRHKGVVEGPSSLEVFGK